MSCRPWLRRAAATFGAPALLVSGAHAADVILSEYNAVSSTNWLGNPSDAACQGPEGFACSDRGDTYFGRVQGNGGDWFELVVVSDHLDMRNWQLYWEEVVTVREGTIFLSDDPFWADLRAGTIITFIDSGNLDGGLDTDISFDPCAGDWWVNIYTHDEQYVPTTTTNVPGQGPGAFTVGDDGWRLTILNASLEVVYGPAGEGAPTYSGAPVNSREICRLEAEPSSAITPAGTYDDGRESSFGSFNTWSTLEGCRVFQTIATLRQPILAGCEGCAPLILNEYNAVADGVYLNGGTAMADQDGGLASDVLFGRVPGNGGDWLELVVIADDLDVRGWSLDWEELDTGMSGSILLSQHALWADLASGTILTLTELTSAQGGLDTDLSYDPGAGDRSINVNTFDTAYVAMTVGTEPKHVSGQFAVSDQNWRLTIRDGSGALVFGPAGEGSLYYYHLPVENTNIVRLEEDPAPQVRPLSAYDDGSSVSTFAVPNQWAVCPDPNAISQSFDALPDPECVWPLLGACCLEDGSCQEITAAQCTAAAGVYQGDLSACGSVKCPQPVIGDVNGDGVVDVQDLVGVILMWGTADPDADVTDDGIVDVSDLVLVILNWG
jgi:hypothetical protein